MFCWLVRVEDVDEGRSKNREGESLWSDGLTDLEKSGILEFEIPDLDLERGSRATGRPPIIHFYTLYGALEGLKSAIARRKYI